MHKKDALKRKKLINQIRHHRVMPNGRVLTADGRETLLGNLAPVKHIPMLPWKRVIAFPTAGSNITVSTTGENAWFYELLKETAEKDHDLIGFSPVKELKVERFEEIGVGSVGIAAQVREIEPAIDGKAVVHLKGICRYENTGFLPSANDHFSINVRWFEDNREADSLVRPQFEECLKIIERLSKAAGKRMQEYFNASKNVKYEYTSAQYLSFIFIDGFGSWFTDDEKYKFLHLRSTAERLRSISERSRKHMPKIEQYFRELNDSALEVQRFQVD